MNYPIKTNQLDVTCHLDLINAKYAFFKLESTPDYYLSASRLLDHPLLNKDICSITHDHKHSCWLMINTPKYEIDDIRAVLQDIEGFSKMMIYKRQTHQIPLYTLLQLLMNALASSKSPTLKYNNLTGHLYCFHPSWLFRNDAFITSIPTLEILVNKDLALEMNIRTFTNIKLKHLIDFKRKKFEAYPQYVLSLKNTLKRKTQYTNEETFILRQVRNKKSSLPFLDISNLKKFNSSKIGMMHHILRLFNETYKELAHIQFKSIESYTSLIPPANLKKQSRAYIQDLFKTMPLAIIDEVKDEHSQYVITQLIEYFNHQFDMKVSQLKNISPNKNNLCLVHNKATYEDSIDPYHQKHPNCVVQHIIIENAQKFSHSLIQSLINEICIKKDLQQHKMTLIDWRSYHYANPWIFGQSTIINDEPIYTFIKIFPDGSFKLHTQEFDLLSHNEYSSLCFILDEHRTKPSDITMIIQDHVGNINLIKDTSCFTVPEMYSLHDELHQGNTYLRNKEARDTHLTSILDIKSYTKENSTYYFVGTIGKGMQSTIPTACIIREIIPYANSQPIFNQLLPLMCVDFIRNGQLTVIPFPFKYLRVL